MIVANQTNPSMANPHPAHISWLLHHLFGYQMQRQHVPGIPAQTSQVALLDLIASLLLNQILRELKRAMFLWTHFIIVIIVIGHPRHRHCCRRHIQNLG